MTERRFKPGQQNKRYIPSGHMDDTRYAWARTNKEAFHILVGRDSGQLGNDVIFFIPRPGKFQNISINLSGMTEEELDIFEKIVNTAIEWARPVSRIRDKEAQVGSEQGIDTYERLYRPVPQLVFRKRPSGDYGEELQQRLERILEGPERGESGSLRVRGAGEELVESDKRKDETQDNGTTTDES